MTTLTAIWDCRYPVLAGLAIWAVSAAVVRRMYRNAPLVDEEPAVIYVEVDPDESVAAVLGWHDDWAAWEAEVAR